MYNDIAQPIVKTSIAVIHDFLYGMQQLVVTLRYLHYKEPKQIGQA